MKKEAQKSKVKSSIIQDMFSFACPISLQKKITNKAVESSESRVNVLRHRIRSEFSTSAREADVQVFHDDTEENSHSKTPAAKTQRKSKGPKVEAASLEKSEKMKQLEAFERDRVAEAAEKRRLERVEKEARREMETEMAEVAARRLAEEEIKRVRADRAKFWCETARQQQQEAAAYNRFLSAKREEKEREKKTVLNGGGVLYKPSARLSYEQWRDAEGRREQLFAEAVREEHEKIATVEKSDRSNKTQQGGHWEGSSVGSGGYDSSMFACGHGVDDDDDLGGTTSMLTAEELAEGMIFEEQQHRSKEDSKAMTAAEMSHLLQPTDWMKGGQVSGLAPAVRQGGCMYSSDFFNNDDNSEAAINDLVVLAKKKPTVTKQSVKSAISEYNASKNKTKLKPRVQRNQLENVCQPELQLPKPMSDDVLPYSRDEPSSVPVSESDIDQMKSSLMIVVAEEEVARWDVKQTALNVSLEKIEDTIEKIDTLMYCRERDLDKATNESADKEGGETCAVIAQLTGMIAKLKQSQVVAEQQKDLLDEQMFTIEQELRKATVHLKALKEPRSSWRTDVTDVHLPHIHNKHKHSR